MPTECYIDFDIDDHRARFALGCAFVNANDKKYGLTTPDLLSLGGSELVRLQAFHESNYEWMTRGPITSVPARRCRVVVELFDDVPLACENFRKLCTGEAGKAASSSLPLHYYGCNVHRIQSGFVIQAGDFVKGNGSGGESVYGKKFKDEPSGMKRRHGQAGVLSMGNSGKHSNGSQFFLTLAPAPQCDGKHCVFGRVTSGLDVLRDVEAAAGAVDGTPREKVVIAECGEFNQGADARHGFWYDPPDATAPSRFVTVPRVMVVVPGEAAGRRFEDALTSGGSARMDIGVRIVTVGGMLDETGEECDAVLVASAFEGKLPWPEIPKNAAVCKPADGNEKLMEIMGKRSLHSKHVK